MWNRMFLTLQLEMLYLFTDSKLPRYHTFVRFNSQVIVLLLFSCLSVSINSIGNCWFLLAFSKPSVWFGIS